MPVTDFGMTLGDILADAVARQEALFQTTLPPLRRTPNGRFATKEGFDNSASHYRLVEVEKGDTAFVPGVQFAEARAAQEYAANDPALKGKVRLWRYITVRDEVQAQDRERGRFNAGIYQQLPEEIWEAFLEHDVAVPWNYFLHWATNPERAAQGWVAYSPTREALVDDKQTTLPFSKFLAKEAPHLAPHIISELQQRLVAERRPTTLHFTRDAGKVRDAYIDREHCSESSEHASCMRYPPEEFNLPSDMHPCDAYVGPNSTLSLAYTEDKEGDIRARAVVSEKAKQFVRVYGYKESDRTDILNKLRQAGYSRTKSFEGERLHLYPFPDTNCADDDDSCEQDSEDRQYVVVPYLDGEACSCEPDGVICDGFNGAVACDTTEGKTWVRRKFACVGCSTTFIETRLHGVTLLPADGPTTRQYVCSPCYDRVGFRCQYTGNYYLNATHQSVMVHFRYDHCTVEQGKALQHAFQCERTLEYYDRQTFQTVQVKTANGMQTWARVAIRLFAWRDDEGNYYSRADFPAPEIHATAPGQHDDRPVDRHYRGFIVSRDDDDAKLYYPATLASFATRAVDVETGEFSVFDYVTLQRVSLPIPQRSFRVGDIVHIINNPSNFGDYVLHTPARIDNITENVTRPYCVRFLTGRREGCTSYTTAENLEFIQTLDTGDN